MRPRRRWLWLGWAAVLAGGCMSGPPMDNPLLIRPGAAAVENPVYVPLGPDSYARVFEQVLSVLSEYFEIRYSHRYDGQIVTFPRIAPGLEQPWRRGDPDFYQRLEATFQTIRHRAEVRIEPAPDGGYFVRVTVYKELEDLPKPQRATAGAAAFRTDNTVDRQYEVIDPTVFEGNWIPLGEDIPLEQAILERIKSCL